MTLLDRISDRAIGAALLLVSVLFVALVGLIVNEPVPPGVPDVAAASPTPTASPAPSVSLLPGLVAMPADADCAGCHADDGGLIVTRRPPVMGHPLDGWRECTACHAPTALVATAPGHDGIHANECLICHDAPAASASPPPHRPHALLANGNCLDCHGSAEAPLPTSMASRDPETCWLCHTTTDVQPPQFVHALSKLHGACLDCHRTGAVGPLPADHANRQPSQCTLCHQAAPEGAPAAGHSLTGRSQYCTECHAAGTPPPTPEPVGGT